MIASLVTYEAASPLQRGQRKLKNKIQDFAVLESELQRMLNSHLSHICYAKIKSLVGKEWDSDIQPGDIRVKPLKILSPQILLNH